MAVTFRTYAIQSATNATTSASITIPTVYTGEDLYVLAVSRDHTSGTTKYTCTDNDTGGNTWTEKAISSDRKTTLFWKKATGSTSAKTISIATTVGSVASGLSVFSGGAPTDPTTNIVLEENASGNEAHAGFTPDNDNSYVVLCVTQDSNDLAVTDLAAATLGSFEPEQWARLNTGGSDCAATMAGKVQAGTKTATGVFSWAQTDGTSDSISFAIKPNLQPATVLNTPDDSGTTSDTTPALNFTGTDPEAQTVEYQVQVDTVNTFDSQIGSASITDSYTTGYDNTHEMYAAADTEVGQAFVSSASGKITKASFQIVKRASATGNVCAKLYACTGTPGTDGKPTGSALATSANYDASTISSEGWGTKVELTFSGAQQYSMVAGTNYCISCCYDSGDATNYLSIIIDSAGSTHAGNDYEKQGANYQANAAYDIMFEVSTAPTSPLINALSDTDAGFTAGHPFASGSAKEYTVQTTLSLITYYWRVRTRDTTDYRNTYGAWATTRSFTVIAGGTYIKTFNGLAKASIKTINGLAIASVKTINGLT